MAVPAMSSGWPMRPIGTCCRIESPKASSVAAIIFDSNGPGAMALTVICRGRAAGQVAGEVVHGGLGGGVRVRLHASGTWRPSIEPMLMTRAGSLGGAGGAQAGRRKLGEVEDALDVEVEHAVPRGVVELVERRAPGGPGVVDQDVERGRRRSTTSSARRRHSSSVERSAGDGVRTCRARDSSSATASHTSALRDEMLTLAPASTKPRAIIRPMPRLPPVTRAVLPAMENRSFTVVPSG